MNPWLIDALDNVKRGTVVLIHSLIRSTRSKACESYSPIILGDVCVSALQSLLARVHVDDDNH